jgi:hypothetical protein
LNPFDNVFIVVYFGSKYIVKIFNSKIFVKKNAENFFSALNFEKIVFSIVLSIPYALTPFSSIPY